jgi:hypothetical protein
MRSPSTTQWAIVAVIFALATALKVYGFYLYLQSCP